MLNMMRGLLIRGVAAALIAASMLACLGCAEFAWLNPILRRQWKEDEALGPTFHAHVRRVRDLQFQAARMPPEEQRRVAAELTTLIKEERNTLLRCTAVRSLAAFPPELSHEGIQLAATDNNPRLREAACDGLGKLGDPAAVGTLAALVRDDELDVRLAAARQLGRFPDPRAVAALGTALDDPSPALQLRAVEALRNSSGRDYGENLELWRAYVRGENPAPPEGPSLAERVWNWF